MDKYGYHSVATNVAETVEDFSAIIEEVQTWTAVDMVLAYYSPELGITLVNPKNPDHWEADHCIDANAVPGVLFSNRGLANFPSPSYADIPGMTIGKQLTPGKSAAPVGSDEDQDALEERLKGLGYL